MIDTQKSKDKISNYQLLITAITDIIKSEPNRTAVLATCAALIFDLLEDINWAGFYLLCESIDAQGGGKELVVGPYVGRPACLRIALGKGVCGSSAEQGRIMRVANVHEFPGHIACDGASNSEIVLPLHNKEKGRVVGVLDIDSPLFSRFDEIDEQWLERIAFSISGIL